MKLSQRSQNLEPSVTLATSAKARDLKASGLDVLSLTIGEPDFFTPENIQQAAIEAIQSGKASFYTSAAGIPELRKAIIERTKEDYGLVYDMNQVVVTDGAKFGLFALFQALLDKEDEVLIPVPYWVSYGEQVKLAEGVPVYVQSQEANDYKVTVDELDNLTSSKTKALILNTPTNPTGSIYSKKELTAIGNWAVENDVLIISDDIYGKLVYNQNEFTPIATLSEEIRKQTIIVNGVSKSYAMTGWRIGYMLGDEKIIQAVIDIISQSTSNCSAVSQYAAVEALSGSQKSIERMRQSFEERLNRVYPQVAALPGFKIEKPKGAFYLLPNIRETLTMCGYDNVTKWVDDLLEEEYVAVVTGEGFGAPDNIRLSYATDVDTIEEAIKRIARFIDRKKK